MEEKKKAVRKKEAKLAQRLKSSRKRTHEYRQKSQELKKAVSALEKRCYELEYNTVIQYCYSCRTEIEMVWDVRKQGFKAYCPVCGKTLMLCDECQHQGKDGTYEDNCDYDRWKDTCKHNRRE